MNRRHAHRFASPALTGGDDRPDTPCTRDVAARLAIKAATGDYPPSPFDVLLDSNAGTRFRQARREAAAMCGECPFSGKCLSDNADEPWVMALRGEQVERWMVA